MKVLLINGSPKAKGNTAFALEQMAEVFEAQGIEAEILHVGHLPVRGCIACGSCYKTGRCTFDDIVNTAAQKFQDADGMVVGSPVYYRFVTVERLAHAVDPRAIALGWEYVKCWAREADGSLTYLG